MAGRSGAFKRWLYRGQRPHAFARGVNRLWAWVGATGLLRGFLVTLEVRGRTSGKMLSLPVVLQELPMAQRSPILKAYLQHAAGARPHIPIDPSAPLTEFVHVAGEFPVFRVVPTGPKSG